MLKFIHVRKYLSSIYLWMVALLVLIVVSFSIVFYLNAEKVVIANAQDNNRRVLAQISYNIEFMSESVTNLCRYLYQNVDIRLIMHSRIDETQIASTNLQLNGIGVSMLKANPFLHSIYVYNEPGKAFYSASNGMLNFKDVVLEEMARSGKVLPKLKPIYREFGTTEGKPNHVFTYLMYEGTGDKGFQYGAVAINVASEWILNSIRYLNGIDNAGSDAVIIVDADGQVIGASPVESFSRMAKELGASYREKGLSGANSSGFLDKTIGGKRYMLSYAYLEKSGFFVLKYQDYYTLNRFIDDFKLKVILLTILCIVGGLFFAVPVSRRIYQPVKRLVGLVRREQDDQVPDVGEVDELTYLSDAYHKASRKLWEYKEKSSYVDNAMRTISLKKLLEERSNLSVEELQHFNREYGVALDDYANTQVCLAVIDNKRAQSLEQDSRNGDLQKYVLLNTVTEALTKRHKCHGLDVGDGRTCFILQTVATDVPSMSIDSMDSADGEEVSRNAAFADVALLEATLKQCQTHLMDQFGLSASFVISPQRHGIWGLHEQYATVKEMVAYRFLKGNCCIISHESIRDNISNHSLPQTDGLEKKLFESLRTGKSEDIAGSIERLFQTISSYSHNSILLSLMHLVHEVDEFITQLNQTRREPLKFEGEALREILLGECTMAEFREIMETTLFALVAENKETATDDKRSMQVQAVVDMITEKYADSELCRELLASKLKISAKQLSSIFSERMGMSVQNYINEFRLKKALEWMESSNLNTTEIIRKVGFENESYFYSLFRKKFGTTPRDYILRKNILEKK